MRIIITGGTGLIGRPLAAMLAHGGHDVIVLSRNPGAYTLPHGVRAVQWDAKTHNGWGHLLDDPETAIVNLAGENPANWRWTQAHKQRVLQSRLDATHAVVGAIRAAKHPPQVLLQASAVGYYGDTGAAIVTESTPPGDDWRAQVCVDWEAAAASLSVRTAILRVGIVLDQQGGALPAFLAAANLFGSRLGPGTQWLPWVHNHDVAAAIRYLLKHDSAQGPFNLVAPNPLTNEAFMEVVARVRGRTPIIPVPAVALKLAMGEMATTVLDSQHILPKGLLDAGYEFHFPHAEAALRDILSHAHTEAPL